MHKWKIPNLQETLYIKPSILKAVNLETGVGLDPVATFYFVVCIERKSLTLPFFLFVL